MRLLNVFTGKLEEYFGSEIPKYAILSHTWGRDEVTFLDIQNIQDGAGARITGLSPEDPLPKLSIPAPTPLKDTLPKEEELETPAPILETMPLTLIENKDRADLDALGMRFTPNICSLVNIFGL
jgi:hypothetical protein